MSRFQGMYWCAHKTATLTSIQHTVKGEGEHLYPVPLKQTNRNLSEKCRTWPSLFKFRILNSDPTGNLIKNISWFPHALSLKGLTFQLGDFNVVFIFEDYMYVDELASVRFWNVFKGCAKRQDFLPKINILILILWIQ